MKIILGLGNPGLRFKFNRHNLGFLVVEKLARAQKIKLDQKAFNCLLGKGTIAGERVFLGLPLTFMNLSAEAVVPIVKQKKIKLADLLIVCDDVNLPLGKIRLRPKGSDGGHRGLRSIIEGLGSESFPRLRVGIGRKKQGAALSGYVLESFNKEEIAVIKQALDEAVRCSQVWLKEGITSAMDKFN